MLHFLLIARVNTTIESLSRVDVFVSVQITAQCIDNSSAYSFGFSTCAKIFVSEILSYGNAPVRN